MLQALPSFSFKKCWPPNYAAWEPGKAKKPTDQSLLRFATISSQGLPDAGTAIRFRCGQLIYFILSCSLNPLSWPSIVLLTLTADMGSFLHVLRLTCLLFSHHTGNHAKEHFFPFSFEGFCDSSDWICIKKRNSHHVWTFPGSLLTTIYSHIWLLRLR